MIVRPPVKANSVDIGALLKDAKRQVDALYLDDKTHKSFYEIQKRKYSVTYVENIDLNLYRDAAFSAICSVKLLKVRTSNSNRSDLVIDLAHKFGSLVPIELYQFRSLLLSEPFTALLSKGICAQIVAELDRVFPNMEYARHAMVHYDERKLYGASKNRRTESNPTVINQQCLLGAGIRFHFNDGTLGEFYFDESRFSEFWDFFGLVLEKECA